MDAEGVLAIYGYPLKDPAATCHACGALGTVGRAIRKQDDREVFHAQLCAACWPSESARLGAQWDGEMNAWLDSRMTSEEPMRVPFSASVMGAATWHGVEAFVRDHLLPAQQSASPRSRADLEAIAAQYRQLEKEYVGEVPPLVAAFIQQYVRPLKSTDRGAAT